MLLEIRLYDDNDNYIVELSKEFPDAKDIWDSEIEKWVLNTELNYDIKYNFADWENAPNYYIAYIDDYSKVYETSMVDDIMNL